MWSVSKWSFNFSFVISHMITCDEKNTNSKSFIILTESSLKYLVPILFEFLIR